MTRRHRLRLLQLIGLSVLVCGCATGGPDPRVTKIQELEDQLAARSREVVQKEELIRQQQQMIADLRDLGPDRPMEQLVFVDRIEIERLSGGYDDDDDGIDDGVVVYLRLYDRDGDTIKAAGSASVRVLDVKNPPEEQQVGAARWTPAELREQWYGKLMTSHYTLRVPWWGAMGRAAHASIVVEVEFTDLLTGRSFSAEKIADVTGAGPDEAEAADQADPVSAAE